MSITPHYDLNTLTQAVGPTGDLQPEKDCDCWYVFDRNEGRSEVVRKKPKSDCPTCKGTGLKGEKS